MTTLWRRISRGLDAKMWTIVWNIIKGVAAPFIPYLVAGSVGLALLGGAYVAGINYEKRVGQENALRLQVATLQSDIAIAAAAAKLADQQLQALNEKDQANENALVTLRQSLADRPANERPLLTQPDVDLLRNIR